MIVVMLLELRPPLSEEDKLELAVPCTCLDDNACGAFTCDACLRLVPECFGGIDAVTGIEDDLCDACWCDAHGGGGGDLS